MRRILGFLVLAALLSACSSVPAPEGTLPAADAGFLGFLDVQVTVNGNEVSFTPLNLVQGVSFEPLGGTVFLEDATVETVYLSQVFRVVNNTNTTLDNLSLYALNQPESIGGTAIKSLRNQLNEPINDARAARLFFPSHRVQRDPATNQVVVDPAGADFQAYTTAEIRATGGIQEQVAALNASYNVLGYGYVARNAANTRVLPPNAEGSVNIGLFYSTFQAELEGFEGQVFSFIMTFAVGNEQTTRFTRGFGETTAAFVARVNNFYGAEPVPATTELVLVSDDADTVAVGTQIRIPTQEFTRFIRPAIVPSMSNCAAVGVGQQCTVTIELRGNDGAYRELYFQMRQSVNRFNLTSVATGPVTAGCSTSISASATGPFVDVSCPQDFTASGVIATLTLTRTSLGSTVLQTVSPVLVNAVFQEFEVEGGELFIP